MAYAFQTFTSNQVFTHGQAQQIEDNIRDHQHGQNGVGAAGLNWNVSSATASLAVVSSMSGKIYEVSGDWTASFDTAGNLGTGFGLTFNNIGSGRILLKPSGSQTIDGPNSQFVLTPKTSVNVWSDGSNLNLFNEARGWLPLWSVNISASTQLFVVDKLFPGDFSLYRLRFDDVIISSGGDFFKCFVSEDSGSTFTVSGYAHDVFADTTWIRLTGNAVTSNQMLQAMLTFTNRGVNGNALDFDTQALLRGAAGSLNPITLGFEHAAVVVTSVVNAIKVMPGSRGFMTAGRITLQGYR